MSKVSCVSDLHLFCRRSNAESHMKEIEKSIADSDIFIFNGDSIDFRWSKFSSVEETIKESITWLRRLVKNAPHCQFHYILGNHDCNDLFVAALDTLATEFSNLEWHHYYIKLGSSLFLHGDVANRRMNAQDLKSYRAGWSQEEQRGEFQNTIHNTLFKLGVHKIVSRYVFSTRRTLTCIQHYLNDIGYGEGSEIKNVYFGHTHVLLKGTEFNGQRFHNGGSPMPGLAFAILRPEVK